MQTLYTFEFADNTLHTVALEMNNDCKELDEDLYNDNVLDLLWHYFGIVETKDFNWRVNGKTATLVHTEEVN